jgi:hypothetical protein
MRHGAAVALAVVLLSACVHVRLGDGPGDADLARPPAAIAARGATLAKPASDCALVVSPGILAGAGARRGDGVTSREGGLGLEVSVYATRVKLGEMVFGDNAPDYAFVGDAWGMNLGWTPTQTRSGPLENHQPSAYVEAQWRRELAGVAVGAAFTPEDPHRARSAIQATTMLGPAYARVQTLLDGNFAFEVGLAFKMRIAFSWAP